jgi:hypothetical protein
MDRVAIIGHKIQVDDKIKVVYTDRSMTVQKLDALLACMRAYLTEYVYTQLIVLEAFTYEIEDSVRKKEVFKFEKKKLWNEFKRSLVRQIKYFNEVIPEDFCEEFAATYYDNVRKDLFKVRDELAGMLKRKKITDSLDGLTANFIVMYNMTSLALETYFSISTRIKEKTGVNLEDAFMEYSPYRVNEYVYKLLQSLTGADWNKYETVVHSKKLRPLFAKVAEGIFSPDNFQKATQNAMETLDDETASQLMGHLYSIDDVMEGKHEEQIALIKEKSQNN